MASISSSTVPKNLLGDVFWQNCDKCESFGDMVKFVELVVHWFPMGFRPLQKICCSPASKIVAPSHHGNNKKKRESSVPLFNSWPLGWSSSIFWFSHHLLSNSKIQNFIAPKSFWKKVALKPFWIAHFFESFLGEYGMNYWKFVSVLDKSMFFRLYGLSTVETMKIGLENLEEKFILSNSKSFKYRLNKIHANKNPHQRPNLAAWPRNGPLWLEPPSLPNRCCEDRCLDPQTAPEVRHLGVPFTPIHKVWLEDFGRLGKIHPNHQSLQRPRYPQLPGEFFNGKKALRVAKMSGINSYSATHMLFWGQWNALPSWGELDIISFFLRKCC